MNKLPAITLSFWIMKICETTLGETAGDLISMTKKFHPIIYWAVILATSTAGTTMSDFMDRTLGLGYQAF